MARVLITNSVPLNGGDEALLRAVVESIHLRWPDACVTVLCKDVAQSCRQLPDLELAPDLERALPPAPLVQRLWNGLWHSSGADRVSPAEMTRDEVVELYRAADVVLSSPGGFLHDFYEIEDRLRGFEVALGLGKPLILLGQSIGPFWKSESRRRIREVLNRATRVCVRDAVSRRHLIECGVEAELIREAADAAFLWRTLAPELFRPKAGPPRVIGMSYRVWPWDDETEVPKTIAKAVRLCEHLLADGTREVRFLSTCQGVAGYIDDSLLADRIVAALPERLRERCHVDRQRRAPRDLIAAYGECDLTIAMRLHACILSMLAGTPAVGLGYEQKTAEIFGQLGLAGYQTEFTADGDAWLAIVERMLGDLADVRRDLPAVLDESAERAIVNIDAVAGVLTTECSV